MQIQNENLSNALPNIVHVENGQSRRITRGQFARDYSHIAFAHIQMRLGQFIDRHRGKVLNTRHRQIRRLAQYNERRRKHGVIYETPVLTAVLERLIR